MQELRERLASLFPSLRGVEVADAWHGILGVSRDWCPCGGCSIARTGLGSAGGYVGEGVAASNLAGRTLRDLVLGRDTELTRLPWVGRARRARGSPSRCASSAPAASTPPTGVADRREQASGRPSRFARLADLVSGR